MSQKIQGPILRHYVGGSIFIFINLAVYAYWLGFVAFNTFFEYGYPSLVTEGPGPFVSTRYGIDWAIIFLLGFNVVLPLVMQFAMTENQIPEYIRMHGALIGICMLINIVALLIFLFQWCVSCNWFHSWFSTACNDYRWCCVFFSASQEAINLCANGVACAPNVTSSDLSINSEYLQHIIFAGVFFVFAFLNGAVSNSLSLFGIFSNQPELEE